MRGVGGFEGLARRVRHLDVPLGEGEILKYFVETSNWFLFRKDDRVVGLMDMYLK
jgi:hypothetical protein